jgi:catechol 2,3-dioxygenase-like lactoylglutathione lyase family enzyme
VPSRPFSQLLAQFLAVPAAAVPEFDAILGRVKTAGVAFGSEPRAQDNGEINTRRGGRGVYFRDANGHSWELLTRA